MSATSPAAIRYNRVAPRGPLSFNRWYAGICTTRGLEFAPAIQRPEGCAKGHRGDTIFAELISMSDEDRAALIAHENKMIRRLRFLVELTFATIAQDHSMTLEQAWEHVRALKTTAVTMFPGKEQTFDLVYLPRFSRLLAERFRAN